MKLQHSDYMKLAIEEAGKTCLRPGGTAAPDVPVGCIIVHQEKIVGCGHNTREECATALGHAEISAIQQACRTLGSWRLSGCTLYVTLEPCPMCMGAILNARIDRVVFGSYDAKAGCCGSLIDLNRQGFCHKLEVLGGIRELECAALLSDFFAGLREKDTARREEQTPFSPPSPTGN